MRDRMVIGLCGLGKPEGRPVSTPAGMERGVGARLPFAAPYWVCRFASLGLVRIESPLGFRPCCRSSWSTRTSLSARLKGDHSIDEGRVIPASPAGQGRALALLLQRVRDQYGSAPGPRTCPSCRGAVPADPRPPGWFLPAHSSLAGGRSSRSLAESVPQAVFAPLDNPTSSCST